MDFYNPYLWNIYGQKQTAEETDLLCYAFPSQAPLQGGSLRADTKKQSPFEMQAGGWKWGGELEVQGERRPDETVQSGTRCIVG